MRVLLRFHVQIKPTPLWPVHLKPVELGLPLTPREIVSHLFLWPPGTRAISSRSAFRKLTDRVARRFARGVPQSSLPGGIRHDCLEGLRRLPAIFPQSLPRRLMAFSEASRRSATVSRERSLVL